ncbi:MAG TPA: hypothetical protein VL856_14650 [Acidimicrobiia bacterium]|nr:hypothetical protein [Acidimicrobiia bacterium]
MTLLNWAGPGAEATSVPRSDTRRRPSGVEKAALAYSTLPAEFAGAVHDCLPIQDRRKLREGLAQVREATEDERLDALRALVVAVRHGVVFPRPAAHEEANCPFHRVALYPQGEIIDMLERICTREPMEVAVTLCHLNRELQREIWQQLSTEMRGAVLPLLEVVYDVGRTKTREYARDVNIRLSRLANQPTSSRVAMSRRKDDGQR